MSIDEKILLDLVAKRYGEGYGENEKTGAKNKKIESREEENITPFDQTTDNNVTMGGGGRLNRQNTSTSKLMKLLNKK